jgi:hypothetical protein
MTYQANNIRGQWKRAFCSATLVGFGGIGGIAGSLVFRSQDKPRYVNGMWACITCAALNVVIIGVLSLKFTRDNKRAARGEITIEDSEVSVSFLQLLIQIYANVIQGWFPVHIITLRRPQ